MKYLIILSLIFLTGCDPVVSSKVVETYKPVERRVSCGTTGYCYRYGLGFNGKMSYSYGFSSMCPGHRQAIVQDYKELWIRKSGKQQFVVRSRTLNYLESCH